VDISFDPAKNAHNIAVHGISLARAMDFEWHDAIIIHDIRRDYGELRFLALGRIESRLHVLVYTPREERVHVISLRKANKREVRRHANQTEAQTGSN
jgi:hypothetical protein